MSQANRDTTALLYELAALWELPELPERVSIVTSGRLRTSLGLYDPGLRQVRLAAFLEHGDDALFREVVVHELAHAAVHVMSARGRRPRPHGREWKQLMRAAGQYPRVRMPREIVQALLPESALRKRARWAHDCPVCGIAHEAGRPMRRWRCRACMEAGRSGVLTITRVPAS